MNRRKALKNVALTFGTALSLPAWANGWTPESLPKITNFKPAESALLNQLVEALIPKTDTPGAGEMGIEKFVMAMVNDCTSNAQKSVFMTQLGSVDSFAKKNFGKSFSGISASEKTAVLDAISKSEEEAWKSFFGMLKRYTVQGYQSSEYVMYKNGFQFAPGFYSGCVDLEES
ncbi:MAG: gluconate 2-dehydrogenase subunit 3 family protein [Spirosomaceae bacterium]|nr:gluconate 2-dehydrogenase subunit 3 family protein [Spirosomataceae bacterium]